MTRATRFPNGIEAPLLNDSEVTESVADLNQTVSSTPTQAEVQAISDKVDELLVALRNVGALE